MRFILVCSALICALHAQGPLAPTGSPAPTQKSLQEIWDQLESAENTVAQQQQQINLLAQQNSALLEAAGLTLSWHFSEVDIPAGATIPGDKTPSLAFSPGGSPSIAYNSGNTLKFAVRSGATWNSITVPGAGNMRGAPSLAYTPAGHAMIAYQGSIGVGLKVAEFDGTAWAVTNVHGGDAGYDPDLALSPSGEPAIAYEDHDEARLCLARFTGGSWEIETITTNFNAGRAPSLAFRSDGVPAVAFQDPGTDSVYNPGIYFAIKEDSAWSQETVIALPDDPEGNASDEYSGPSLAFSPSGQAAIAYQSYDGQGILNYAVRNTADDWSHTDIFAAADWGFSSTLAFNGLGQPAIGFITAPDWDDTPSSISYAVLKNTGWSLSYGGRVIHDRFETSASMAFAPTGQPAMAFYNRVSGKLSYAVRGSSTSP